MPPPPKKKLKKPVADDQKDLECSKKELELRPGDWRSDHWSQRNYHAVISDLLCDVSFEVGEEKKPIRAHRLILALSSPVFEAMFYGPMKEIGPTVTIPDITPEGFEALLKYIYTGESITTYNIETLIQLWVAADKYCIPQVKVDSIEYFSNVKLNPQNGWSSLEAALFLEIEELAKKAKSYLAMETLTAIKEEGYLGVNAETMSAFLQLEPIRASETYLLSMLVKWGEARKGHYGGSLQKAIEPCIKYIRFASLSSSDFSQFLETAKGAISNEDAIAIFKYYSSPLKFKLPAWCSSNHIRHPFEWVNPNRYVLSDSDLDSSSDTTYSSSSSSSSASLSSGSSGRRRRRRRENRRD